MPTLTTTTDLMISSIKKGFTLIELVVTTALIGVIALFAISQFSAFKESAYNAATVSAFKDLENLGQILLSDMTINYVGAGSANSTCQFGDIMGSLQYCTDQGFTIVTGQDITSLTAHLKKNTDLGFLLNVSYSPGPPTRSYTDIYAGHCKGDIFEVMNLYTTGNSITTNVRTTIKKSNDPDWWANCNGYS